MWRLIQLVVAATALSDWVTVALGSDVCDGPHEVTGFDPRMVIEV
jgi:hypothetical protein